MTSLATVAEALNARRTGHKAHVVGGIVARLDALDRAMTLGDDPVSLAKQMTVAGLRSVGRGLGICMGANRYGLAAQIIGKRDQLICEINTAIDV